MSIVWKGGDDEVGIIVGNDHNDRTALAVGTAQATSREGIA
jgi:hypothetical protein